MEFENEYAQRMPMGRVAQVGALVLVVMIVLFVVFWNPAPPVPADVAKQITAGESSGGGYTFANTPESNVSAVIESGTPPLAPLVSPGPELVSAPPVVAGIAPAPVPMPPDVAPSVPVAAPRPTPHAIPSAPSRFHEITDEDTLYRLAHHYYGNQSGAALIIKANRLVPPYRLPIGMKLVIPAKEAIVSAPPRDAESRISGAPVPAGGVVHTVQQGDSLYRLATKYFGNAAGVARIKEANQLASDQIRVGQRLVIPGVGADAPVPATQSPHD